VLLSTRIPIENVLPFSEVNFRTKSHDMMTEDMEDTWIQVSDMGQGDPGNRTRGTRFIYIFFLRKNQPLDIHIKNQSEHIHTVHSDILIQIHQNTSILTV